MAHTFFGIFTILHGLVHGWYVTLSQRWVPFEPEMGWTGHSWLLSNYLNNSTARALAALIYAAATLAFMLAGAGIIARAAWWPTGITTAAILSSLAILTFWDGSTSMLVQKGLLGFLISAALLTCTFLFDWTVP